MYEGNSGTVSQAQHGSVIAFSWSVCSQVCNGRCDFLKCMGGFPHRLITSDIGRTHNHSECTTCMVCYAA